MIFFGERHLQHSIDEFLKHYHGNETTKVSVGRLLISLRASNRRKERCAVGNDLEACSITIIAMQRDDSIIWIARATTTMTPVASSRVTNFHVLLPISRGV